MRGCTQLNTFPRHIHGFWYVQALATHETPTIARPASRGGDRDSLGRYTARAMIRYPRLAAAALFALLAVSIVALWVRSYWWMDYRLREVGGPFGLFVHSQQGQLRVFIVRNKPLPVSNRLPVAFDDLFYRETFALPTSPHRIPAQWPARREVLSQFQWTHYPDGIRFVVPHWFPAASSLCIAAIFAFKRTWRYSLRTIIVAMTLTAGLLGLAVYVTRYR